MISYMYDGMEARVQREVALKKPVSLAEQLELTENVELLLSKERPAEMDHEILRALLQKIESLELAYNRNNNNQSEMRRY